MNKSNLPLSKTGIQNSMRKIIILEINEVPFRVYDHYMSQNPDSVLSRILKQSAQYITQTTDQGELHPWSTWPTLYRGVDNTVHEIKDIGEDLSKRNTMYPSVWNLLADSNIKTGVFASLHTYPLPSNSDQYCYFVPDPFANGADTHPKKIEPFQEFNLAMSRKSGRSVDRGIDKKSAFKLLVALPGLGLRFKTLLKTMRQLLHEKVSPWVASRRRTFQSVLAFDIFLKLLKKEKPSFTTFFSNHVASAMHRYWAATFPDDYNKNDLPKEWIDRYAGEIPYCMDQLNDMIKSLSSFLKKNPEYKLVIASSMGQEATEATLISHELFLKDAEIFKNRLGDLQMNSISAMHPQYNFSVAESDADKLEGILKSLHINDVPLKYRRKENTFFSIDLGYPNIEEFKIDINGEHASLEDMGFEIRNIDDQSGGTAYHIPDGTLFIYDPKNPLQKVERKTVDLREVAPSLLRGFGIKPPDYMKEGIIQELFD